MKYRHLITGAAVAGALALVLTGCVPNTPGSKASKRPTRSASARP
jgi:hypothetical protein